MKIQQESIKRKIKHKHSQYSKNITEKKTHTHTTFNRSTKRN